MVLTPNRLQVDRWRAIGRTCCPDGSRSLRVA